MAGKPVLVRCSEVADVSVRGKTCVFVSNLYTRSGFEKSLKGLFYSTQVLDQIGEAAFCEAPFDGASGLKRSRKHWCDNAVPVLLK
ncbi:hypothetical protein [Paraburkholderia sp.]|uniref:hypothetical protein n=1 Tax=Paraburkholderia sp. TaxID=1926495 RepID=UPI003D6FDC5D